MATTTADNQVDQKPRKMTRKEEWAAIVKGYLVTYNVVQSAGWGLILMNTIKYLLEYASRVSVTNGNPGLYDGVKLELRVFQTMAVLEVLHCMIGIVRSNVGTTLMQVYSRLFVVWGVIEAFDGVSDTIGLLLILLAWSITEIIRYAYYALSLLGNIPYPIQWLRYTLFYVLYPMGVLGEMVLVFSAMPLARASQKWSISMPNKANMPFSYYYFMIFTVIMYIPGFPQLYGYMIKQRKKVLAPSTDKYKKE